MKTRGWKPSNGCLHGQCRQKNNNLTIFIATHFLYGFLHIWKEFCNGDVQLNVDNILSFHYVVKWMHI